MLAHPPAVSNIHEARHDAVAGHRQRLVVALSPIHRLVVTRCGTRFVIQRVTSTGNLVHAARSVSRTGITWLARKHAGPLPADVEAALAALPPHPPRDVISAFNPSTAREVWR